MQAVGTITVKNLLLTYLSFALSSLSRYSTIRVKAEQLLVWEIKDYIIYILMIIDVKGLFF